MAAVQAPIASLAEGLKSLVVSAPSNETGEIKRQPRKAKITEEEKKAKVFGTSYEPSLEWWTANQKAYVKPDPKDDPLPDGFPEIAESPSLWDGKVLINQPERWLYRFTPDDIKHLNAAYDHFKSLSLSNNALTRETFPIPADSTLYKALEKAVQEIQYGLGLRVLRGLPVDEWTREKQLAIFGGISSYIGDKRLKQQGVQSVVHLRDITNLDVDNRPVITVKGQTSGNQVFHNDGSANIVGLITLGVAESGGLSQLSSVAQTYNEFATTRRDILRELAKDDWKTAASPEGKPLIFNTNGRVLFSYSRRPFFGFFEAEADVPALPEHKHLALDAIHFTAEKFSLDLDLEKGDLEYFNNLNVFHARTSSEDSETNQRHLVRIWLENRHHTFELPEQLVDLYARLNDGEPTEWPLEAWDIVPNSGAYKDSVPTY